MKVLYSGRVVKVPAPTGSLPSRRSNMKIAVYPGYFDPFTNGHMDIVEQASKLFDMVYIAFAINAEKTRRFPVVYMTEAVAKDIKERGISNVEVIYSSLLVSRLAGDLGADYLVRGLRNPTDYAYEEYMAKVNKTLNPNLHTIYLRADNEVVSSSMVRDVWNHEEDVSPFVSPNVFIVMGGKS